SSAECRRVRSAATIVSQRAGSPCPGFRLVDFFWASARKMRLPIWYSLLDTIRLTEENTQAKEIRHEYNTQSRCHHWCVAGHRRGPGRRVPRTWLSRRRQLSIDQA